MSNVLDHTNSKRFLRSAVWVDAQRIGRATGVHRVTVGEYLRAAGIPVRGRGRPGEGPPKPTISEEVSTDSASKTGHPEEVSTDCGPRRPVARRVPAPVSPIAS